MNEKRKLEEAKYFLIVMKSKINENQEFIYNLSAFLSSARSVLQYAWEDASQKSGGQQWYSNHMNNCITLSFFKDKRNLNIHEKPVVPDIEATFEDTVHISPSVRFTVTDKNGNVISEGTNSDKDDSNYQKTPTKSEHKYVFSDWEGNEDIISLCDLYIRELEIVVNDGMSNNYISG